MNHELFDEFFASNQQESISPFLTPQARKWGEHLPLKTTLCAAFSLIAAYILYFFYPPAAYFLLCFVFFFVGTPAFIHALKEIGAKNINIDVLMTLAAILSIFIGSPFEGALLLVLFELSSVMEEIVESKTKSSVHTLHKIFPRCAFVIGEKGHLIEKSIRDITVGTTILVKAGEVVPLDGIVLEGRSYVNLVHLTGESAPVMKEKGSDIAAGSGNLDGSLTIQVTRTASHSTLSQIIDLMTKAHGLKPKIEQFFDTFSQRYASSIILLSLFFALLLPYWAKIPFLGTGGSIYRALAFLIAASPCALILATPTAYLSALSSCAKKGILPKGGAILDALNQCRFIAFDKTGTLTTGNLVCTHFYHLFGPPIDLSLALQIAASLERNATHPIAKAITQLAQDKHLALELITDFKAIAGFGLQGTYQGKPVYIGHYDLIQKQLPDSFKLPRVEKISTYLWILGTVIVFEFEDQLRDQAKEVVHFCKQQNLKTFMLTGDHLVNAKPIADLVKVDELFADLRPQHKLQKISELSTQGHLIMIGDGMNDAPSLARSTVGIAMGKMGSMTAIEAADIILMHDDLPSLSWLLKKARHTKKILIQNITIALIVILFATTPSLLGAIPLWLAVILHEGGTVLVGLNSLRLLKK